MQVRSRLSLYPLAAGVLLLGFGGIAGAQSTDPLVGTWKLNLAKSTFSPGPAPKAVTLRYEAAGQGLKVTVDSEAATGRTKWEYQAGFDGKDYAVTGNAQADMVSLKRLTSTSSEAAFKKGGKATTTSTRAVSADGKTLTITTKGTNTEGKTVNDVQVFERQ
jgi:hypothetical protein